MEKTYATAQVAKLFGLHPNTVRLYESWGFLSPPERRENGYRVFTEEHLCQMRLARTALRSEVLQNGLRSMAIVIIRTAAKRDYYQALLLTDRYLDAIEDEIALSESAVQIAEGILQDKPVKEEAACRTRKQAAERLNVSTDTLRNWERNGLLRLPEKQSGALLYTGEDIQRLRMVRALRVANYSLAAILRAVNGLRRGTGRNLGSLLNKPDEGEFILSVCDRLRVSLRRTCADAEEMKRQLTAVIKK